jgi:2-phospho-L-lactate guanylyltransferase (CobY/MobA/RfbA family)
MSRKSRLGQVISSEVRLGLVRPCYVMLGQVISC